MPSSTPADNHGLMREALTRAAVTLTHAGLRFALAGGYGFYARGGPEPQHDVDLVIDKESIAHVQRTLREAGFEIEEPPEDWLFKAWWRVEGEAGGVAMVDVIHRLGGEPVDEELLNRAEILQVGPVRMPVLDPTDMLAAKLRVLTEHECDFGSMLPAARALREQIDWARLRQQLSDQPYAEAFLHLVDRLGLSGAS